MTAHTFDSIPHLRKTKNSAQLIVHGKPLLMLSAELHNSSLSSPEYMTTVWGNMKDMHVNTLLGAVTWEMIEPVEDDFNFAELDQVILDARKHGMHLVLLWFGSFKNALSTYVPEWVKKDVKRFPRVHICRDGGPKETIELLSPFCHRSWEADAKAFGKLCEHIRQIDADHSTVLMIQVENETGLLGDSRDRSRIACELFEKPVPQEILQGLRSKAQSGTIHPEFEKRFPRFHESAATGEPTWQEAFGTDTKADELFMADAFSRYVGKVAAAGKAAYPIPMYTNVWLNLDDPSQLDLKGLPIVVGGGAKAGKYPSGGPCPHTMDLWNINAPALDFIGPDLYFHDYEEVCRQYTHQDQPLFIPEQRRDAKGARRVWLAYGTYAALGCSPFGIDSELAKRAAITKHYALLESISSILLEAQARSPDDTMGFFFDEVEDDTKETRQRANEESWSRTFGNFVVTINRAFVFGKPGAGAGLIIHQGQGRFLLVGCGFQITFKSSNPRSTFTGILSAQEKGLAPDGQLKTLRVLNGDETRSGSFMIMPNEDPDYGGFPVAVTIPCRTMIAECKAYSVEYENEDDL